MAFNLDSKAQEMFFPTVFEAFSPILKQIEDLKAAGIQISPSIFTIDAKFPSGTVEQLKLTGVSTTAMMKSSVAPALMDLNKDAIASWVKGLHDTHVPKPEAPRLVFHSYNPAYLLNTIKVVREITGWNLVHSKKFVEDIANVGPQTLAFDQFVLKLDVIANMVNVPWVSVEKIGFPTSQVTMPTQPTTQPVAKPLTTLGAPIPLREAHMVGQPVKGTSAGSVYHCIAVNKDIRLAARIKQGTISIRAEWVGDEPPADLKKLTDMGLTANSNYASVHMHAAGVPSSRIIGAMILGSGIKWDSVVQSGDDLVEV